MLIVLAVCTKIIQIVKNITQVVGVTLLNLNYSKNKHHIDLIVLHSKK